MLAKLTATLNERTYFCEHTTPMGYKVTPMRPRSSISADLREMSNYVQQMEANGCKPKCLSTNP